jgi:hypothetical protein
MPAVDRQAGSETCRQEDEQTAGSQTGSITRRWLWGKAGRQTNRQKDRKTHRRQANRNGKHADSK